MNGSTQCVAPADSGETTELEDRTAFIDAMLTTWREYSVVADDLHGRIVAWNDGARAVYGYEPDEVIGHTSLILCAAEDKESGRVERMLNAVRATGSASGLLTGVRKNGHSFPALVTMTRRTDLCGVELGVTTVSRDITGAPARETDADHRARIVRAANRQKREFLSSMSHELRAPLNTIIGMSALLHAGKAGPMTPMQTSYLEDVLGSADDLLRLMNDVLDLAKLRSGKMEIHAEPFELDRAVEGACNSLLEASVAKGVDVIMDVDAHQRVMIGDAGRVKQVLQIYLSNAIKFTPTGGRVVVRARRTDTGDCRLEVEDHNVDMAAEALASSFGATNDAETNMTDEATRAGVGLALARGLVEAQGGTAGAVGTPGVGSVFYAILPVYGANTRAHLPAGGD